MAFFRTFRLRCKQCGYKNQPHKSPREGIRLALLNQLPPCKGCGKQLRCPNPDRPLAVTVRAELVEQGLLSA